MKKILIFIIITFLWIPGISNAQTSSPTNSIPSSKTLDEIKDKVASRVAQLNLVEKKGVVGRIESVTDTQITINTLSDKRRIIDVDEFTDFQSPDSDSFGISDIKKGSVISALGLYNKESERLLARFINEVTIPLFLNGIVSEIDGEEFTITITTEDNKSFIVDVEKITKTFAFNDGELEASGFSDLVTLKNVLVIGFEDPSEEGRLTASKIIIFPNLPKNPKIKVEVKEAPPSTPAADTQ